jgi:hypothetical protein
MFKEPLAFQELMTSRSSRCWKWSVSCSMIWNFICQFQQQKLSSGYFWPNLFFPFKWEVTVPCLTCLFSNVFLACLIRRFLRAVQASRKVRLSSYVHSATIFCTSFISTLTCLSISAGSFCDFGIPGQLSCGADSDRLWLLEFPSFGGGGVSGVSCKMDTRPIWPPMGSYEKHSSSPRFYSDFAFSPWSWWFVCRTGHLNTTPLTEVLISRRAYMPYGSCSTTPVTAPSMLYAKSIAKKRYAQLVAARVWVYCCR